MTQMSDKKNILRDLIYLLIAAFILSVGLNVILLSGYLDKGENIGLDKRYQNAKLDKRVLDLIDDRPLRVKLDFYPPINIDEFRAFAQNHGLKPVIFSVIISSIRKKTMNNLLKNTT